MRSHLYSLYQHLPDTRLKEQVAAAFEANARLQESFERIALPVQAVDNVGTYRGRKHTSVKRF